MRRCKSCGRLVDDTMITCPHCGKSTAGPGMESGPGRESVPYASGPAGSPVHGRGFEDPGRGRYYGSPGGDRPGDRVPPGPDGWREGPRGAGYGYPDPSATWRKGDYKGNPSWENKGMSPGFVKKLVAGIIALSLLLIVGIVGIVMFMRAQRTVDLEKVTVVNYEGYEGYGTATAYLDMEKLNSALAKAMGRRYQNFSDDSLEFYGDSLTLYNAYYTLYSETKCTCDKSENLKNGDRIHVDIQYGNDVKEAARTLGIILKGSEKDDKVKNLQEIISYDPFQNDVEIVYSGSSPYATAEVNYAGEYEGIDSEMFKLDKSENIKIGDTLNITLDTTDLAPEVTKPLGFEIGKTEGQHKVAASEVNYYIDNAGRLTDTDLQSLQNSAGKAILDYFDGIRDYVGCGDPEYQAAYVFMSKYNETWDANNYVFLIYKIKVTSKEGAFKTQDIYIPVQFENVIVQTDLGIEDPYASALIGETDLQYNIQSFWPGQVKGYKTKKEVDRGLANNMGNNYVGSKTKGFLE